MTRHRAGWAAAFAVGAVVFVAAQKVVGPEEFDRAMKTIGASIDAVDAEVASGSHEAAKTPLALARQVLASTRPVWETSQRPDAVRMTREAVAALDALDKVLSGITVDAGAVDVSLQSVMRACDACHAIYREGDDETGYRMRTELR